MFKTIKQYFTPKPKYNLVSITFKRTVPSFYGLCGLKTEELIMTDSLHIHDWEIGIYEPEGFTYVCSNYELDK